MRPKTTRPLCASQGLRGTEDMQTCGMAPSDDLRPATATQQAASRELVTGLRRHIAFQRGTFPSRRARGAGPLAYCRSRRAAPSPTRPMPNRSRDEPGLILWVLLDQGIRILDENPDSHTDDVLSGLSLQFVLERVQDVHP